MMRFAVGNLLRPGEIKDVIDLLEIHGDPLKAVRNLNRRRMRDAPADLLEIGKLGDLHPVEPDLPAEPPRAEGGRFPIILDEPDIMVGQPDSERGEALQVEVLNVFRGWLVNHLVLIIALKAVRILTVTAVGRPAGRLDIGGAPRFGPQRPEKRIGMKRAGP